MEISSHANLSQYNRNSPYQRQRPITLIQLHKKIYLDGYVIDTGIPITCDLVQPRENIQGAFLWQACRRRKGNMAVTARRRDTLQDEVEWESEIDMFTELLWPLRKWRIDWRTVRRGWHLGLRAG